MFSEASRALLCSFSSFKDCNIRPMFDVKLSNIFTTKPVRVFSLFFVFDFSTSYQVITFWILFFSNQMRSYSTWRMRFSLFPWYMTWQASTGLQIHSWFSTASKGRDSTTPLKVPRNFRDLRRSCAPHTCPSSWSPRDLSLKISLMVITNYLLSINTYDLRLGVWKARF